MVLKMHFLKNRQKMDIRARVMSLVINHEHARSSPIIVVGSA